MNNEINIALCLDDNYFEPTYLLVCSILATNKNEAIAFHIIFETLSEEYQNKFQTLQSEFIKFNFRKISNSDFANCPIREDDHVSLATYYRLLLPVFVPEKVSKILYIDGDMLCFDSLRELYETDLTNFSMAACYDSQCQNEERKEPLNLKSESKYFAAGTLLINLDYWRKNSIHTKLMQYIADNSEKLLWHDQDTLNAVLEGTIKKLDFRYNFYETYFKTKDKATMSDELWNETQVAKMNICILHYMQSEKPWFYECENPLKDVWLKYYKKVFGHECKRSFKYGGKRKLGFIKNALLNKLFKTPQDSLYMPLPNGLKEKYVNFLFDL